MIEYEEYLQKGRWILAKNHTDLENRMIDLIYKLLASSKLGTVPSICSKFNILHYNKENKAYALLYYLLDHDKDNFYKIIAYVFSGKIRDILPKKGIIWNYDDDRWKFLSKTEDYFRKTIPWYTQDYWNSKFKNISFWPINFIEWQSVSFWKTIINKKNYEEVKNKYQGKCNKNNQSEFMIWMRFLYSIIKIGKEEANNIINFDIKDKKFNGAYMSFSNVFPFAKNHKESNLELDKNKLKKSPDKYLTHVRNLIKSYFSGKIYIPDKREKGQKEINGYQLIIKE